VIFVNSNYAVYNQISKFFVSHMEESVAGHMGTIKFIKGWGGKYKRIR
jgi:hypothetical protein